MLSLQTKVISLDEDEVVDEKGVKWSNQSFKTRELAINWLAQLPGSEEGRVKVADVNKSLWVLIAPVEIQLT